MKFRFCCFYIQISCKIKSFHFILNNADVLKLSYCSKVTEPRLSVTCTTTVVVLPAPHSKKYAFSAVNPPFVMSLRALHSLRSVATPPSQPMRLTCGLVFAPWSCCQQSTLQSSKTTNYETNSQRVKVHKSMKLGIHNATASILNPVHGQQPDCPGSSRTGIAPIMYLSRIRVVRSRSPHAGQNGGATL